MVSVLTNEITIPLEKYQKSALKRGTAKVLLCANCGNQVYYGEMNLISLAIRGCKPVCSYVCNKALGQI